MRKIAVLLVLFAGAKEIKAQYLMDMIDTTKESGKGLLSLYKRFDHIRIGGYIQPQFQYSTQKGAKSFEGGDFGTNVNNRFLLRRARVRFEYVHFAEKSGPSVQFVFQFDGTERGVFARDFWGRVFENKYKLFSLTTGLFARPFGFETNYSSSDRESPERGRMNQLLMRTERDIGVMLSLDSRKKDVLKYLKIDAGIFNGQGLTTTADFDSHKDLITRVALKPYPVAKNVTLSAAASYLNGGLLQNTKYVYRPGIDIAGKTFLIDSASGNAGKISPRKYFGADAQLKIKHKVCVTELRAEFITGRQTGTGATSETPVALLTGKEGYYVRQFAGAYFYFLQHIVNKHHQLVVKYDWYDPNTNVKGSDIGKPGTALNSTDIKYATLGVGYVHYFDDNLKLVLYYDKVWNEKTQLAGFTSDVKDDVFTCRLQFRF
jgi:hypothetical protein